MKETIKKVSELDEKIIKIDLTIKRFNFIQEEMNKNKIETNKLENDKADKNRVNEELTTFN